MCSVLTVDGSPEDEAGCGQVEIGLTVEGESQSRAGLFVEECEILRRKELQPDYGRYDAFWPGG